MCHVHFDGLNMWVPLVLCFGPPLTLIPCNDTSHSWSIRVKHVQGTTQDIYPCQSAAPRKRHNPPLISALLREMLDSAKPGQAGEDTVASHQSLNRRLFAAQGFAGKPVLQSESGLCKHGSRHSRHSVPQGLCM